MLSVTEARSRILKIFQPLPSETLALTEGLGRVLSTPLLARTTQPPAAVSAMDGYAVRAADVASLPAKLEVVGEIAAGSSFIGDLQPGQAVRIFTGAPLPSGGDTIVIQENVTRDGDWIDLIEATRSGAYVRPEGLDFRAGETALPAGRRLTARDLGLAAAMNHAWLPVHRRPRVAILATGDEIALPGDPRGPSQIVSSNAFSLTGLVLADGGLPVNLGIAPDRGDLLQQLAEGAKGCDLLVTTGGASVGKHDLVRSALAESGLEVDFWRIAMRPGKPLLFGRLQDTPLLGLPGNPVSTLVCGLNFLRPILRRLQGLEIGPRFLTATLGKDLPANDRREDYLRSHVHWDADGQATVIPFERQDSSMLAVLSQADALAMRPPHAPSAKTGDPIRILLLDGGI
ncbi:MAG: molybdopterin molybdotransferase MoeA [Rhodospirillales bacterium]|nr:molybdopterin molybdotransferase MoeA [Rhodospirillales bacterium]